MRSVVAEAKVILERPGVVRMAGDFNAKVTLVPQRFGQSRQGRERLTLQICRSSAERNVRRRAHHECLGGVRIIHLLFNGEACPFQLWL
ncbi:hypothetical protein M770_31520 (plasmid) [Pseudomonas aeruginosa VRFPA03]|nr:hypothetical protein M770_31520 [Pseudomonas aeruginosa VRFPA03]